MQSKMRNIWGRCTYLLAAYWWINLSKLFISWLNLNHTDQCCSYEDHPTKNNEWQIETFTIVDTTAPWYFGNKRAKYEFPKEMFQFLFSRYSKKPAARVSIIFYHAVFSRTKMKNAQANLCKFYPYLVFKSLY